MVLTQLLFENAKNFPKMPALTMRMGFRTVTLTYQDVYELSCKFACLLEKEGIKRGDKILLMAPNSPYWICCFWGALLLGAVVVPLNVQSTAQLLEKVARQTGAKLLFAFRYYREEVPADIKRYDLDVIKEFLEPFSADNCKACDAQSDDLVEILYTSGTTGDPKGVMLTHKNLFSNIKAVCQMVKLEVGKERILSVLPLSHIFEQAVGFLLAFYYAAHVVYAYSPAAIGLLLREYQITKMISVPEILKIMMSKIESSLDERKVLLFSHGLRGALLRYFVRRHLGGKLDTMVSAGAPLDAELERKWNALGIILFQGYGLTETSPLVSSNTYADHKFGSVGKVAPGVSVRIAEDGEIQVKGDNVFAGYFKDETRTRETFTSDGWFKTGDIGEFDQDGFLFLKGRKKYMILGPGGQNVFPEDIEEVLNTLPGVKDSTVLGIELPGGNVQVHAVLLLEDPAADAKSFIEQANKRLASYQRITGWTVWAKDDFPRSATRKVKKDEVRKFLEQHREEAFVGHDKKSPLVLLLASVTGIESDRIGDTTTLIPDLQLDSLMRVELIARIEDSFGVLIDELEITMHTTVADLERMLVEKRPIKGLPPLRTWPQWWPVRMLRFFSQYVIFLFLRIFVRRKINGLEYLKDLKGPVVFMPNHVSYLDPFVLVWALPARFRSHLALAAANDVLYGDYWFLVPSAEILFNTFPFPRKEHENVKLGLDYMGKLLDQGLSIVVYPEGKISTDGALLPLKKGAGLIAVEMDVTVVPVMIKGSDYILPYETMFPRHFGRVEINFGKPMKFSATESYVAATDKIEVVLKNL